MASTAQPPDGTLAPPRLDPAAVDRYLARIAHPPVPRPTRAALASLQDAQVRSVPFENLDIHLGVPLSLDVADLAAKIVDARRGGFCYELNGLFCALLVGLGFDAWLVEARSREDGGGLGPRFDHARILVRVGGETLLVDVGNGASPRGPIRLEDVEQRIGPQRLRVRRVEGRYDSYHYADGAWRPGWSFDTTPRALSDFAERCRYQETSPESHFTQKPLCSMVTEEGHVTLSDLQLIVTGDGDRREEPVHDPLGVLADRFGVVIDRWPGTPPGR